MAHGLLTAPVNRLQSKIRLPIIQDVGAAVNRQFGATLMPRDSLRRSGTSRSNVAIGPLPSLQTFVMAGPGQPNTPESMSAGLRRSGASRLVTKNRGQSAGV